MQGKNWVLGAATGLILIGSLLGVGCKSSTKNDANATNTAQSGVTPAQSPTSKAASILATAAAAGTKAAETPAQTPTPY